MAGKAQYLADQLLNWLLGDDFAVSPGVVWLALATTIPTLATQGTEVTGGSYGRIDLADWVAVATRDDGSRYVTNSSDIVSATATADWGDVIGWEILDDDTTGNRLFYGELNPHQFIQSGSVLTIPAGSLVLAES